MSRNCSICAGGIAPVNSDTTSPSRNALTAGNAADLEVRGEILVRIDVHLRQRDPAVALRDGGLQSGPELAARAAPLGPEVDYDRQVARALDDLGDEVRFVYV